ncbi:DDE-type integrase/transposase/recombinase [Ruegeria sp. 2012CJ41-6]|uniref:DDE-type integrase/transposase/recombinase n=1 Tax=Ruegeria spongiae TaxID=2942209 RepID=A0ABT0Q8P4_9RHOB|nr:DDE-type integrase/transposase/recombinase [Ruegeria spongiae]MCL6286177.1 DDE-type integrase/transposase/recombinase [Ruegeria spongiae]
MKASSICYKRHRFPPQIIAHAVWLYFRFNLSLREVEEMLLQRQNRPGDVWHLDEGAVRISGRKYWLWRAVDPHGVVLDEIVQPQRDKRAAKRLLRRLMKRLGFIQKRIITDKLRSYGAAKREVASGLDHWSHKGLNNRTENSHLPFRKRERTMQDHRSPGGLQRFVATHSATRNCFCVPARRRSALTTRYHRLEAFDAWNATTRAA